MLFKTRCKQSERDRQPLTQIHKTLTLDFHSSLFKLLCYSTVMVVVTVVLPNAFSTPSFLPPIFLSFPSLHAPEPEGQLLAPSIVLSLTNTGAEWRCTATQLAMMFINQTTNDRCRWVLSASLPHLFFPPSLSPPLFSHHASPLLSFCVDLWFIVPCRVSRSLLTRAKLGPGGVSFSVPAREPPSPLQLMSELLLPGKRLNWGWEPHWASPTPSNYSSWTTSTA